jgi:formylglycine-generating enzyme required for sulfatase activity/energy-coupling factor transporter ATP-binding protein EcfA2
MSESAVEATVLGGQVGIAGVQSVFIANLNVGTTALSEQPTRKVDKVTIPPCPYPGLTYFGPQDSALFFGRDAAIARLETAVNKNTLTALVGASGSGKSSVVLAGLAPRLNAQGGWRFSHFRFGLEQSKNPFMSLARALLPLMGEYGQSEKLEETQKLATKIESGEISLQNALSDIRASNINKRILLIADQFEEIFTVVADEELRKKFIDVLLSGFPDHTEGNRPDICLVLTLRADFYGMVLRYRPLADALQSRIENLGPMTRDELRQAIENPAGAVHFEVGLVDTLLDDVADQPGTLPLLQFALREMWARLEIPQMTRANYDAIGGVKGALAQRAQAIFDSLTNNGQDVRTVFLFRQLFTRLVSIDEDTQDTRRVVEREELGESAWELAQRLAGENNRLVVTTAPAMDHETVELTHEALIKNWPTFVDWINRDRDFQSWLQHQLKPRVEEWRKNPEDEGTLLRGGPLRIAEEWLKRRHDEINDQERSYIDASVLLREADTRRDRKTRRRMLEMRAFVSLLVAIIAVGLTWLWTGPWLREHIYSFIYVRPVPAKQAIALGPSRTFQECVDCPTMVVIPAGSMQMGSLLSPHEQPPHLVTITEPFAVSKTEITFAEWDACVTHGAGGCNPGITDQNWGRGSQPVINVSWDDAKRYTAWLSRITGNDYSLLSEAQWEYAARGTKTTYFSFGDDDGDLPNFAWYFANAAGKTDIERHPHRVGELKPNLYGLNDVHGNVAEWVEDCYRENYIGAPSDGSVWPSETCFRHVVRGGSFQDKAPPLRSSTRDNYPNKGAPYIGFRVARRLSLNRGP